MPQDKITLWEAFASGEGWSGGEDLTQRPGIDTAGFYNQVIAPAFEYQGFTQGSEQYFSAFEDTGFQQAEEEFSLATGGIFSGEDPFAWENISRYSPGEAQDLLEGTIYGAEDYLGGEIGEEYKVSTAKARESYTSALRGTKESLSYSGLMGDISKQSGTSGMALRTGSGRKRSENILEEAYKESKSLGSIYSEDLEQSRLSMQGSLDLALSSYLSAIDQEKTDWYQNILTDVSIAAGQDRLYGTVEEGWTGETGWEEGLSYEDQEYAYQQGCGIGQIYIDGQCQDYAEYAANCPEGFYWNETIQECAASGGGGGGFTPDTETPRSGGF